MRSPADNVTDFLVVSEQRSGSTWLKMTLNSHPEIFMFGELFMNDKRRAAFPSQLRNPGPYADKKTLPRDRILSRERLRALGLKAFHYSTKSPTTLNPETNGAFFRKVMAYFRDQRGVVVHLRRSNHLDRFISQVKSRRIGGGHCDYSKSCDETTLATLKLHLDLKQMLNFIRDGVRHDITVNKMLDTMETQFHLPVLRVDYETLAANDTGIEEWRSILKHLRLPPDDTRKLSLNLLTKDIQKSHAQVIANFDAVCGALKNNNFLRFLKKNRTIMR